MESQRQLWSVAANDWRELLSANERWESKRSVNNERHEAAEVAGWLWESMFTGGDTAQFASDTTGGDYG